MPIDDRDFGRMEERQDAHEDRLVRIEAKLDILMSDFANAKGGRA